MNKGIVSIIGIGVGIGIGYMLFSGAPATEKEGMEMMEGEHMDHAMLEVDTTKPIPSVTLEAIPDAKDGYNVHLTLTNFAFVPEKINQDPVANEGHAHLYVNGVKRARIYGTWFHIGANELKAGENTIKVTLNANDHSEWVLAGEHIAASVTVTK